jgi:hypothetical protein
MQKEELEKTKNWLVGDEKGVKLRASQRAELNIEVSPKTAKFEKFVFPPIFKNRLLTFLRDALTMAHPCKYQFN